MAHDYSIIEFFPDRSASNCGYCSGTNCSVSTGMWAHVMTVEDYQDLINRNWRRSGKYCYHPNMKETCCPPYMIKCDTKNFRLGKHHKKLIKKFNRYLMTGQLNVTETEAAADQPAKVSAKPSQSKHGSTQSSQSGDGKIPPKHVKKGVGADPTKPKAVKAKQLRLQKKLKSEMAESSSSAQSESSSAHQSREKGLADLLEEYDSAVAKHKFELRLVRSHPPSKEFEDSQLEEYEVYKKYQMTVHKDPESKVTFSQFKNFLISSPLVEETRHGVELGSFHYQYILDGKIIAVEVMDILPQFISSKYFFYDPAYDFLTLGTYSTLSTLR
ncbi:ATE1 [Bugula neritina]|uniref:arginyltransferase n=1 Tax=Bugula neritina TaxID=10212 RepID=A0A7J7KKL0_BUGNE|nr:ATE1 [Bugula neritina]